MSKILFWVVVILGALIAARMLARHNERKAAKNTARPAAKATPQAPLHNDAESMVRCAHCGIHLPRSEALLRDGNTWCSQEHAQLGVGTSTRA